jgi:hypothetical protein
MVKYVRCVALAHIRGDILHHFLKMQMDLWVHSLEPYCTHEVMNAAVG